LSEWHALYTQSPWGEEWGELRFKQVADAIKAKGTAATPGEHNRRPPLSSPANLRRKLHLTFAAMGAVEKRR